MTLSAVETVFGKRRNYSIDSRIPSIPVIFCLCSWLLTRLHNDPIVKLCPFGIYVQTSSQSASVVLFIHPTSPSRFSLPTLLSFPPLLPHFSHTSVSLANQPAIDTMAMLPNLSKGKSLPLLTSQTCVQFTSAYVASICNFLSNENYTRWVS